MHYQNIEAKRLKLIYTGQQPNGQQHDTQTGEKGRQSHRDPARPYDFDLPDSKDEERAPGAYNNKLPRQEKAGSVAEDHATTDNVSGPDCSNDSLPQRIAEAEIHINDPSKGLIEHSLGARDQRTVQIIIEDRTEKSDLAGSVLAALFRTGGADA